MSQSIAAFSNARSSPPGETKDATTIVVKKSGGSLMDLDKTLRDIEHQRRRVIREKIFKSDIAPKLAARLTAIMGESGTDRETRFVAIAEEVVYFLKLHGQFYKRGTGTFNSTMYFSNDYRVLHDVHSDTFRAFVSRLTGIGRASKIWQHTFFAIEDAAIGEDVLTIEPKAYWHVSDDATYITYKPGQVIRINSLGMQIVANGTDNIVFPQSAYISPWDLKEKVMDPFRYLEVFTHGNFRDAWGLHLLKLWTLSMFCLPTGCNRPILTLAGDYRSGKTAISISLMKMLGVHKDPMSVNRTDKSEESLWLVVDKGGIVVVDNIDDTIPWIGNSLCCISSGDSLSRRTMYTDKGETIFYPNAYLVITTAKPVFCEESSVADRLLIIAMEHRDEYMESSDKILKDQANYYHSEIMSWIVKIITKFYTLPLANCDIVKRSPSFSAVAVTLGQACGDEVSTEFALQESEKLKKRFNLSFSNLGKVVVLMSDRYWQMQPFEGDAQSLLTTIQEYDSSFRRKSLQEFVEEMRHLTPNLAQHIKFSVSGPVDNPIYRICGTKGLPTDYSSDQVPSFEKVQEKI